MTIRLIGLNHGYQLRGCVEADWSAFEQYLLSYSVLENIDIIAEELSDEDIRKWKAEKHSWRVLRKKPVGLSRFCDPQKDVLVHKNRSRRERHDAGQHDSR